MELLIMCYACKTSSCNKVIGVIPYMPYSRQSECEIYFFIFYRDVNNVVMELMITAYACKTSTARNIIGVIPYLPYSKQCMQNSRQKRVNNESSRRLESCVRLLLVHY